MVIAKYPEIFADRPDLFKKAGAVETYRSFNGDEDSYIGYYLLNTNSYVVYTCCHRSFPDAHYNYENYKNNFNKFGEYEIRDDPRKNLQSTQPCRFAFMVPGIDIQNDKILIMKIFDSGRVRLSPEELLKDKDLPTDVMRYFLFNLDINF